MADFKTHISASTMLGIGYGVGANIIWDIPAQQCVIAAGLCSVAGMLPDLDSDSGIPVRETLSFVSVLVPALMIPRFQALGMSAEQIVFAAAVIYIVIRFGIGTIFKKYTVHRGMWHSIPAALIAGLAAFLVCLSPDFAIRIFKSWAVVMGFLLHLILDEIYAVDLQGRRIPRLKKSFGTALKFFSKSTFANISTYAKLIILIVLVMGDATVMAFFDSEPLPINELSKDISDRTTEWVGEFMPAGQGESDAKLR